MIRKIKSLTVLWLVLFMLFSLTACGGNTNTYTLPDVSVGDTFEISVKKKTRQIWSYEISPSSGIEYVAEEYIPDHPEPDWCGGGGTIVYTFKATKADHYKIKFKVQLAGEFGIIQTNTYKIKVVR